MQQNDSLADGKACSSLDSHRPDSAFATPVCRARHGASRRTIPNKMALITSDCGTMCYLNIKWP